MFVVLFDSILVFCVFLWSRAGEMGWDGMGRDGVFLCFVRVIYVLFKVQVPPRSNATHNT